MRTFRYLNGNYIVEILEDSTGHEDYRLKQLLRNREVFSPAFPDSIDLKITNSCSIGCKYCHESSKPGENWFNIEKTKKILEQLPKYPIEIAIGGGDVLENPSLTAEFIEWCESQNFRPRITVNCKSVLRAKHASVKNIVALFNLVRTVGISVENVEEMEKFEEFRATYLINSDITIVYHIIAGIFDLPTPDILVRKKLLVLGFKQWGRGKDMEFPAKNIEKFKQDLLYIMNLKSITIGFDNLAIDQLDLRNELSEEVFNKYYMGDEFTSSMYIDAVNEKFAPTSRDPKRVSWDSTNLIDFFRNGKN